MRFSILFSLLIAANSLFAQLPCGQSIDFNTWNQEGVAASGNWVVGAGGNSVLQTINGQSTWFVSPNDFINVLIQGSIQVNTAGDDDLVGFVFGYQDPVGVLANPANTYTKTFIFDWKQGTQVYNGLTSFEGFALYEVDGNYNYNNVFYNEFWARLNTPIITVMDTDYGNNGWNDFQQYDFQLKYTTDSIVIWIDGVRIFEEDGCFEPGKFGFYNFSQSEVNYNNFSYNIQYDFDASDTLICLGDTSFFEIGAGCASSFQPTTAFTWDFDDGNTASGVDPYNVYAAPGTYQAQLISSDPFGCADTSIQIVEVMGYPVANAGIDETVCGLTHTLNAAPSDGQWIALNGGVFTDPSLPNSSVNVPSTGVYDFIWEATNIAGCSTQDTVSIEFTILSLSATTSNPSCDGSTNGQILITTSGGNQPISFQWDAAAGNQTADLATNLGAGTFGVIVTDNIGCFIDTSFSLTAPLPFTYNIDVFPSDCDFSDGSATISAVAGGTAPYMYDWGTGLVPDSFSSGLASGTYSVTISDSQGCDSTFTFAISNTPFVVSANVVDHISCFGFNDGEAIALGPNMLAVYSYQWGATSNNQTTETATNLIPGNHTVTITSTQGCSETVSVTILEPTALTVAASDVSGCVGDLVTISASASGGTPTYTFAWENSLGQVQDPIDILVDQTEIYTVTATDDNGCVLSENVTITALETPVASFVIDEDEACLRPSYSFNYQNTTIPAGGTISWDFGDNSIGSGNAVTHTYTSPGFYTVGLEVTSPNGCTDSHIETGIIAIHPNPVAEFTFSPGSVTTLSTLVQFIDLSYDDVDTWSWNFGELMTDSGQNPAFDFDDRIGNQTINLLVENIYGCIDSTSRIIEIKNEVAIYAPNTFTPDGDEHNQTWRVHLAGMDLFNIEINIYNRWGERVWQSFDINVGWDGTYNGVIVPNGVYTWSLVADDLNTDGKYEEVGHVSILR